MVETAIKELASLSGHQMRESGHRMPRSVRVEDRTAVVWVPCVLG